MYLVFWVLRILIHFIWIWTIFFGMICNQIQLTNKKAGSNILTSKFWKQNTSYNNTFSLQYCRSNKVKCNVKLFCNECDILNVPKNWGICRWNFRETIWREVSRLQGAPNYFIVQVLVPWRLFDSPCWCRSCSYFAVVVEGWRAPPPHRTSGPFQNNLNVIYFSMENLHDPMHNVTELDKQY